SIRSRAGARLVAIRVSFSGSVGAKRVGWAKAAGALSFEHGVHSAMPTTGAVVGTAAWTPQSHFKRSGRLCPPYDSLTRSRVVRHRHDIVQRQPAAVVEDRLAGNVA